MSASRDLLSQLVRASSSDSPLPFARAALQHGDAGLLVLDAAGPVPAIVYANDAFATLCGYSVAEILGLEPFFVCASAEHGELRSLLDAALASGVPQRTVAPAHSKSGGALWLSFVMRALPPPEPAGHVVITIVDVTGHQAAHQRIADSEYCFRTLTANAQDIVTVIDASARITLITGNFLAAFGVAPEERLGHSAFEFVHPDDTALVSRRLAALGATAGARDSLEFRIRRPDGSVRWLSSIGVNLLHDPLVRGIVVNSRDVTERRVAEEALARTREHLDIAVRGARIALWENDVPTDVNTWLNDEWYHILGVDPALGRATIDHGPDDVHPDDLDLCRRARQAHIDGLTDELQVPFRMRTADGGYKWLLDRGRVTSRGPDGRALKMSGMTLDIDALKRAEFALRESESRLEVAVWATEIGLWDGNLATGEGAWLNDWCKRWNLDACEGADHERQWTAYVHPDDLPGYQAKLATHLAGGTRQFDVEYRIRNRADAWVWIQERGRVIERDASGRALRMVGLCLNIDERRRAAAALEHSEQRFDLAVWGTQVGFWDLDVATDEIHWWNDWCDGVDIDPFDGSMHSPRWDALIHPEDVPFTMSYEAMLEGGAEVYEAEYRMRTRSGDWRWILSRGRATARDAAGRALKIAGVTIDIDARKHAELALRATEQQLELAVQGAQLPVWDYDFRSNRFRANHNWYRTLGYELTPAEAASRVETWESDVNPDDLRLAEHALREHAAGHREFFESEFRMRTAQGGWKWLLDRGKIVEFDAEGKPQRLSGVCIDIDSRKRMETALRESEAQLEAAVWGADLGLWDVDCRADRCHWLSGWCEQFGFDPCNGEGHARRWLQNVHEDDVTSASAAFENCHAGRRDYYERVYRLRTCSGEWRWVHERGRAFARDATGRATRIVGVCLDIDARRRDELSLRETQAQLEIAVWASEVGFWDLDLKTEDTRWINDWCRKLDLDPCEGADHVERWVEHTHPDDRPAARIGFEAALNGAREFYEAEYRVRTLSGRWLWILERGRVVTRAPDGRAQRMAGICMDIDARKSAEVTLRTQATILETMREGVAVVALDASIRLTNPAFDRMFGYAPGAVAGTSMASLVGNGGWSGDLLAQIDLAAFDEQQRPARHMTFRRRDGSSFAGEAVITSLALGTERLRLLVVQDITERKKLEQEIIEIANREQQRIGSDLHDGLGQELTGVALMLRSLATRLHRSKPEFTPDVDEVVGLINHAIESARALARGLSPVALDRGGLVFALRALVARARESYGIDVRLRSRVRPELGLDVTTAGHLYRIVQEALNNAVRHGHAKHVQVFLTAVGGSVRLTITDDGCGLPQDRAPASGMGLKIMEYRARMINGEVTVKRGPRGGTRVRCVCGQPEAKAAERTN